MGLFSFLFSKATGGVISAVGDAVHKNVRAIKGDRAEEAAAVADEQLAVLANHAAEFSGRKTATAWDSFIDGINRLPRPLIVFWVLGLMILPFFSPSYFVEYMEALSIIPEQIWIIFLTVVSFFMGSRLVADLKPPRMSPEQKKEAMRQIEKREQVILENRTPLIVERSPDRKPPAPAWTLQPSLSNPPIALPPTPITQEQLIVKGRPADVDKMIEALIEREAGFVNDPADSGKATCWGITHATLEAWREQECSIDDVKNLTKAEAHDIYLKNYYFGPSIDTLPIPLQAHVLDVSANSGPNTSIRMLQQALNRLGSSLKEDGTLGPLTRDACNSYDVAKINNTLVGIRIVFYKNLAAKRPKDQRFLRGWLIRARSFAV